MSGLHQRGRKNFISPSSIEKYREIFDNLISFLVQFEETSVIQLLIFQTSVGFRIFHRG